MATQFILVSHALTQWNIEGRIQGHTDVPLNHLGEKMSQWLANRLDRETIHAIYTSDLKRAYQTARPTAKQKSIPIIQDIRLREARTIFQERSGIYPILPFSKERETKDDLYYRMDESLSEIALSHDGQTVLVVSHGGSLDVFISRLLEKSRDKLLKYQGIRMALNRIRYDSGQWHCMQLDEDHFFNMMPVPKS
ncbi:MAG: histidine phosphatase family protein [Desulfobacteraceae bacterium]|nr:histidine phosphatase family protein [Desulfobacteraceae bacterium]